MRCWISTCCALLVASTPLMMLAQTQAEASGSGFHVSAEWVRVPGTSLWAPQPNNANDFWSDLGLPEAGRLGEFGGNGLRMALHWQTQSPLGSSAAWEMAFYVGAALRFVRFNTQPFSDTLTLPTSVGQLSASQYSLEPYLGLRLYYRGAAYLGVGYQPIMLEVYSADAVLRNGTSGSATFFRADAAAEVQLGVNLAPALWFTTAGELRFLPTGQVLQNATGLLADNGQRYALRFGLSLQLGRAGS